MSFLNKLFGNKDNSETGRTGGMEDFMMLLRVYFQAGIAAECGITNLAALPDLRVFKATFRVPTQNNKLGVGEKARCKKLLKEIYGMSDNFFKEIDQSLRSRCRKLQDVQGYLMQFQTLTQDQMMLVSNLMKFKLRIPLLFKNTLTRMVEDTVHDILTKNDYTDIGVMKTAVSIRELQQRLKFSEEWMKEFTVRVILLAKKEPNPGTQEAKNS
jgi:hypothetical protein